MLRKTWNKSEMDRVTHSFQLPAHAGSVFDCTHLNVIFKSFLNNTKHSSSTTAAFPPAPQSSDVCQWDFLGATGWGPSAHGCCSPARIRAGKCGNGQGLTGGRPLMAYMVPAGWVPGKDAGLAPECIGSVHWWEHCTSCSRHKQKSWLGAARSSN